MKYRIYQDYAQEMLIFNLRYNIMNIIYKIISRNK